MKKLKRFGAHILEATAIGEPIDYWDNLCSSKDAVLELQRRVADPNEGPRRRKEAKASLELIAEYGSWIFDRTKREMVRITFEELMR